MSAVSADRKCREILEGILQRCQDNSGLVAFTRDWGGNSLTVNTEGGMHTHIGQPEESFDDLVDGLHCLLCKG